MVWAQQFLRHAKRSCIVTDTSRRQPQRWSSSRSAPVAAQADEHPLGYEAVGPSRDYARLPFLSALFAQCARLWLGDPSTFLPGIAQLVLAGRYRSVSAKQRAVEELQSVLDAEVRGSVTWDGEVGSEWGQEVENAMTLKCWQVGGLSVCGSGDGQIRRAGVPAPSWDLLGCSGVE